MDAAATLLTVDSDPKYSAIAVRHLEHDRRVTFIVEDAAAFLTRMRGNQFDLIFADTWAGKFDYLEEALTMLRPGGLYIIDDMLPQPNWPDGHAPKVPRLIDVLERDPRLKVCKTAARRARAVALNAVKGPRAAICLSWSSGIIVATHR